MITFKCKMCGGDLSFEQGASVAECPYCGTRQTLPKLDDDRRANLYDRANHFRRQNEYDKAMSIYEQILAEDRTDAEAYWSLVLCRYGIEYVEDPATHKRIPTVNRAQYASILADEDYKSALENADSAQRSLYEAEANAIAEIQKGILDISRKEKPFDVFICYKETDDSGTRTPDSVLANDLYHQLTREGFKVFFSRITLEDKIGTAYEPYIFAALNSAKVMVVLGTKPEYFNAVWVKNEWSRYLALIRDGAEKTLVPAYRDMDPYDLPEEFAHLQALDMGKLGFMQDLIHGIKKLTSKDTPAPQTVVQQVVSGGANIDNLMKRARLFMEDGDWDSADEYLNKVLDLNAEYAPAYIGKVQVARRVRREEDLAAGNEPLTGNADYQKAMRFGDERQKAVYEGYNSAIEDRLEQQRKEAAYREADALEKRAAVEDDFLAAAKKYDEAGDFSGAKERAADCRAKAAAAKQAAERQAEEYRKQLEKEREERRRQEEAARKEAERKAQQERIEAKKRMKWALRIAAVLAVAAVLAGIISAVNKNIIQPKKAYDAAQTLLNDGQYDAAADAFEALGKADKAKETYYTKAEALLAAGSDAQAREAFLLAGDYQDAAQQVQQIDDYGVARAAAQKGDSLTARSLYAALGDYRDSAAGLESANQALYADAEKKMQAGDIAGAYEIFAQISDYQDSAEKTAKVDADYQAALDLWNKGDKTAAETALEALNGWNDTVAKLEALREEIADDAAAAGDYDTALDYYGRLSAQTDAVIAKTTEARQAGAYQRAAAAFAAGDLENAYQEFTAAGSHADASEQAETLAAYMRANAAMDSRKYAEAFSAYNALGGYLDSAERLETCSAALYSQASVSMESGDLAGAHETFALLGGYSDSADIASGIESDYAAACKLLEDGNYDEAKAAFDALKNYEDSETQAQESLYAKAEGLWNAGDKTGAEAVFEELNGWGDTADRLEALREEIADDAAAEGDYDTALEYYGRLSAQTDAIIAKTTEAQQAKAYRDAAAALVSGEIDTALAGFSAAGDYRDAVKLVGQLQTYQTAKEDMEAGRYTEARNAYRQLGGLLDSAANLETCNEALYQEAKAMLESGDVAGAYSGYSDISDYSDSAGIVSGIESDYAAACKLLEDGNYDEAKAAFDALKNYEDSETRAKESLYRKAGELASKGEYPDAISLYTDLAGYRDCGDLAVGTRYDYAKSLWEAGDLDAALREMEAVGGYADAPQLAEQINTQIADAAMEQKDYAAALAAYQRLQQTDEIKAKEYELAQRCYDEGHFAEATNAYETLGAYELSLSRLPIARYAWANQLFEDGSYAEAAEQFALLGDMGDSAERAKESTYQLAMKQLENAEYDAAKATFSAIKGYSDADSMAKECDYRKASDLQAQEEYAQAEALFSELGSYSDSETHFNECRYVQAEALLAAEAYQEAQAIYFSLGSFKDSPEKTNLCIYRQAEALLAGSDYAAAEGLYASIPEYGDSSEKKDLCVYRQAEIMRDSGNPEGAEALFESLGGYQDSALQAAQCSLAIGDEARKSSKLTEAVGAYHKANALPEAQQALYEIAKDYASVREYEKAIETLWAAGAYPQAQDLLKEIGSLLAQGGETELSAAAILCTDDRDKNGNDVLLAMDADAVRETLQHFDGIGDFNDDMMYRYADVLRANGKPEEAYAVYSVLTGFRDVDSIIENDDNIAAAAAAAAVAAYRAQFDVGNTVTMGSYAGEAVQWRVLAQDGEKRLLIAEYGLEAKPYNDSYTSVTWETCTLRKWLNSTFLTETFSAEEQKKIVQVTIQTERSNDTADKIFLLSIDEAKKYFVSDDARKTKPTAHAKSSGA